MNRNNGATPKQIRIWAKTGMPLYDIVKAAHVTQEEIAQRASLRAIMHGDHPVSRKRVGQVLRGYIMTSAGARNKAKNDHILRETARALGVTFHEVRFWWDRLPGQLVGDQKARRG